MVVSDMLGSMLGGTLFSMAFSGVIGVQTLMYFRKYPNDPRHNKMVVAFLWFSDAIQSIFVAISAWQYFIVHFGEPGIGDHFFITICIAKWFTAIMTFGANIFYCGRIYRLSKGNWWITGPLSFLTVARLATATATSIELIILQSASAYARHLMPLWTSGLANAALTDILITIALCYYLRGYAGVLSNTEKMLHALMILTVHNGALTTTISVVCLICWVTMPDTLIFFAFYIIIGKLYAMSLIASLNMRNWIRERSTSRSPPRNLVVTTGGAHLIERSYFAPDGASVSMPHTGMAPTPDEDLEAAGKELSGFESSGSEREGGAEAGCPGGKA